ncbi:MAG: CDP-alcohol phosphatidyltransferase family protein [Prevotella sp.]|nr:CDP-alcohol phosphatidyltransferase family protein [Prevotella sp.]MBQ7716605.1 CDP-alcohol phosphatidyltransferase family protein [Prevotella sp.]
MKYRDFLQKVIYQIINPLIKGLIKMHITPNAITTIGLLLNILAAAMIIMAADEQVPNLPLVGWAGFVILFAGLFDMIDGRLARMGNMSTTFGALWDSTLDRYSELVTLFAIVLFFMESEDMLSAIVTFAAMVGSVMVSYVRARAEGLDIECKVGLMQRPERVVLTALGCLLCGIFAASSSAQLWLIVPMWIIAILANITAFWRVAHCYKELKKRGE